MASVWILSGTVVLSTSCSPVNSYYTQCSQGPELLEFTTFLLITVLLKFTTLSISKSQCSLCSLYSLHSLYSLISPHSLFPTFSTHNVPPHSPHSEFHIVYNAQYSLHLLHSNYSHSAHSAYCIYCGHIVFNQESISVLCLCLLALVMDSGTVAINYLFRHCVVANQVWSIFGLWDCLKRKCIII